MGGASYAIFLTLSTVVAQNLVREMWYAFVVKQLII